MVEQQLHIGLSHQCTFSSLGDLVDLVHSADPVDPVDPVDLVDVESIPAGAVGLPIDET